MAYTKKEVLELAKTLLTDNAEAIEKLDSMIAQLSKPSTDRKPTATQIENVGLKKAIVAYLTANPSENGYTISELVKKVEALSSLESQKVSALVRQLKEDGIVVREEIKRKAYFKLAEGEGV